MPTAQAFTAVIEHGLNKVLAIDNGDQPALRKLQGKQLRIDVSELPWPLVFTFSDSIQVMAPLRQDESHADCELALSLATLQALRDSSQITRLIQQQSLTLNGDIHVAQHFSQLMSELEIDWEGQLAEYIGDVAAYAFVRNSQHFVKSTARRLESFTRVLAEGAIEEKRIAPHKIEVMHFSDNVNDLKSDLARLEARLARLENAQKSAMSKGIE